MFGARGKVEGGTLNTQAVEMAVDKSTARNLERSASYVWKVARNSLKPGKQKPVKALTEEELIAYRIAQRKFKSGESNYKPERPTMPSRPGDPPRLQRPRQLLKVFLLFARDPATGAMVIGSARMPRKGLAPNTLEKGGTAEIGKKRISVAPRPYMVPAMEKERSQMAKRWQNSIKK